MTNIPVKFVFYAVGCIDLCNFLCRRIGCEGYIRTSRSIANHCCKSRSAQKDEVLWQRTQTVSNVLVVFCYIKPFTVEFVSRY